MPAAAPPATLLLQLMSVSAVQVLVIGGAGRVGSAVATHLLSHWTLEGPLKVAIAGRRGVHEMQAIAQEITRVALCPYTSLHGTSHVFGYAVCHKRSIFGSHAAMTSLHRQGAAIKRPSMSAI